MRGRARWAGDCFRQADSEAPLTFLHERLQFAAANAEKTESGELNKLSSRLVEALSQIEEVLGTEHRISSATPAVARVSSAKVQNEGFKRGGESQSAPASPSRVDADEVVMWN